MTTIPGPCLMQKIEAVAGVTIYQDTPPNQVAKVSVVLSRNRDKVEIRFRSLVLVGPSSFRDVPHRAEIPDQWPEQCQPWLKSTWCVNAQHEKIQALSREIRADADAITATSPSELLQELTH